jgi:hypothetical protein
MKTSFVVVGTVCAAVLATLQMIPMNSGTELFSMGSNIEVERAFINFIATYGRSYASKSEIPVRFE